MTSKSGLELAADRILALGYAEARMRNAQRAKLDALLEATVAVCDLTPPPLGPRDYYLSDVSLRRPDATEHSSSLARFDEDTRVTLKAFAERKPVPLIDDWSLLVPARAAVFSGQIQTLWRSFLPTCLSCEPVSRIAAASVPDDIATLFNTSLRAAFDAIAREDRQTYTIRIECTQNRSFTVRGDHSVNYAMGYWLSTGKLQELQNRDDPSTRFTAEEIVALEELWRPEPTGSLRTQSHTNVGTHLAGIVRQQKNRSENEPHPLEVKAWGTPPPAIFMMPLLNHELSHADGFIRTLAHAYLPVEDDVLDTVVDLVAKRQRLERVFAESLYEAYCRALAHALAKETIEGLSIRTLNERCTAISTVFGCDAALLVHDRSTAPHKVDSLAVQLMSLRRQRLLTFNELDWGPDEWTLMGHVAIEWLDPYLALDVLPYLVGELAVLSSRRASSVRAVRNVVRTQIRALQANMFAVQQVHEELRQAFLADERVDLSRFLVLHDMFIPARYVHKTPEHEIVQYGDWRFAPAHDIGQAPLCETCRAELDRRLGWVFDAVPNGAAVNWEAKRDAAMRKHLLESICGHNHKTMWELLKMTCYYSRKDEPVLGALFMLLCNGEVTMAQSVTALATSASAYKRILTPGPIDWQRLLGGVVGLARWEAPKDYKGISQGKSAELSLLLSETDLSIVLTGHEMEYDRWVPRSVRTIEDSGENWWKSSRRRQLMAVLQYENRAGASARLPGAERIVLECQDGSATLTVRGLVSPQTK